MADPSRGPGVRIDAKTKKALAMAAVRLESSARHPSRQARKPNWSADTGTTNDATPRR